MAGRNVSFRCVSIKHVVLCVLMFPSASLLVMLM